jgi:hypothetical protein
MGLGGSKKLEQQMQQQEIQFKMAQSQLANDQAQRALQQQQADAAARAEIAGQMADANGSSPAAQAAAKLSVMDFIKTSSQGLGNDAKTGSSSLLGNIR